MTANNARNSQQRALRSHLKNQPHVCADCGASVGQHKLGRSAHDRMSAHTAVTHRKFLDRDCKGSACVASPAVPRERRGMAFTGDVK